MTIRITRNAAGNCINFIGSSMPAYFNACLSGEVDPDDNTKVNIINDVQSEAQGQTRYEFYQIPYTELSDKDGAQFASAQEAADYVTSQGNVIGERGDVGRDLTGVAVDFRLDPTQTSIIMDNGSQWGVNTIKAVANADGTIHIKSIGQGIPTGSEEPADNTLWQALDHKLVSIDSNAVTGGLNDVVNALNELFEVGAYESVVANDPVPTYIIDATGTATTGSIVGTNGIDPDGTAIFGSDAANALNGYKTTDTISNNGEYFTFDIRNEGKIGFGLVLSSTAYSAGAYATGSNTTYIDPTTFGTTNSEHSGFQWSHWLHPTNSGSWTTFGAKTGYIQGPAWYNADNDFESRNEWLAGDSVTIRVGIDEYRYLYVSSLQDDDTTWILHARSNYTVPADFEAHLGIKVGDTDAVLYTQPKVHEIDATAPTMYFRWIESPDGNYEYPLFATAEEAEWWDQEKGGSGTSHTHVYTDDPTFTSWHMPDTTVAMTATEPPEGTSWGSLNGQLLEYTEITSLTDAQQIPAAYTAQTIEVDEGAAVNISTQPSGAGYTTTLTDNDTSGLTLSGGTITGTAPTVTSDNVVNPSDDYTFTVTRTNSFGSSTGTLTVRVINLTAPTVVSISGFTWEATSTALAATDRLDDGSVVSIDDTVADGRRLIIPQLWVESYILPSLVASGDEVYMGVAASGASWTTLTEADFDLYLKWEYTSSTSHTVTLGGSSLTSQSISINSLTDAFYDYAFEMDGTDAHIIACNANAINTEPAVNDGGVFSNTLTKSSMTAPITIHFGANSTQMDYATTYLSEIDIPAGTASTSWTKALDFSGSSERAEQQQAGNGSCAIRMSGTNNQVSAPTTSGNTVSAGHPWATACVFKTDGHNSTQHVWNFGEGTSSTNDNIYLSLNGNGNPIFGWGRSSDYNEVILGNGFTTTTGTSKWWGFYIAHNGTRYGSGVTAQQLADAFDIRIMHYSGGSWQFAGVSGSYADSVGNRSTLTNWQRTGSSTGARMNRGFSGDFTVGGLGPDRSFHGKVASMVVTTLRCGVAMPSDAEITAMVTDPITWVADYKAGNDYRLPSATTVVENNFQIGNTSSTWNPAQATQIWLMGDGSTDSYSNMIRNQINPSDQTYTKLNMISMVSNDIENVTIAGLT